jgi:hypothetical protein
VSGTPEFSIGEYVQRKFDGAIGVVKRVHPYEEDFVYYVELDPATPGSEFAEDRIWAGTREAWTRFFRMHAHMSSQSRDCDGDYSHGHVYEMTLAERTDQFGEITFKERVMGSTVSLHGTGELRVSPLGLEWHEDTEEGYRRVSVTWCEDECPHERSWQRDHRAEAMGY